MEEPEQVLEPEEILSSRAERIICRLFNDPAPIIFITGRHGRGKTDFGLLIAFLLCKNGVIKKFSSNIRVFDSQGYDYMHISNIVKLKSWLYPKNMPKLFILDEAGINVDRRNPLGKLNKEIRYLGFLLRKYRGKLILISQRSKDIESTFADTDIWLGTFKKLSQKEAILTTNLSDEPFYISEIPKSPITFDSYDIAEFTTEPEFSQEEATSENQQILFEWVKDGNYSKVAKAKGLQTQQIKRIVLSEVKAILSATVRQVD